MQPTKLIVIGGGAAGFFCAVNAARMHPSLQVVILEKSGKLLSKVRISGGGRCNVTHACFDIGEMKDRYPRGGHFVKKTFHQFFTTDTIKWFEERGVLLHAESDGRMFPVSNDSSTIVECLLKEASKYGVAIRMNAEVIGVQKVTAGFSISVKRASEISENLDCDAICIACGGYPKTESFQWIERLGHSIESPVPSLFTFNMPGQNITALMGLSVEEAKVKINGTKLSEQGSVLITHWGLSGPAVLRTSAWGARLLAERNYAFEASINWLGNTSENELNTFFQKLREKDGARRMANRLFESLPSRLWLFFLEQAGIKGDSRVAELTSSQQRLLVQYITRFAAMVKGKTTFKEEFVTCGGVQLSQIDPNTMQSRIVPGIYFAGEAMDVDGITGGYNFQHAWTSGFIAAKHVEAG